MVYLTNTAYILYPGHEEITSEEFRITKTLYFIRLGKMDYHKRMLLFSSTYHSDDNVTSIRYHNYVYFCLASNPGSIQECYYYGKQIVNN